MDMGFSETSHAGHTSWATIHGFRVESYGKPLSPTFQRGLRRLANRGFDDPTCVVVKTTSGSRSGITHAGGRYLHSHTPYSSEVMRQMRELGMEPPPPPSLIAPGDYTLYHEWGHHVDHTWSGDNQEIVFSFRWLSRFYELGVRPSRIAHADHGSRVSYDDTRPIAWDDHATDAAVVWCRASSELFAELFEDWMRAAKRVDWDPCEPSYQNASDAGGHPCVRIALLPGVRPEDVRAETYALFTAGIRTGADIPTVRPGLFGAKTHEVVDHIRQALRNAEKGDRFIFVSPPGASPLVRAMA